MKTVDVNTTTLKWEDYLIVKNAKQGDIVTLSDGVQYKIKSNETHFHGRSGGTQDYIPYGTNNTSDNW